MKKIFLIATLVIAFSSSKAQDGVEVKMKQSGSRAVILLDNYFNEKITKSLLKQMDEEKLLQITLNSNEGSYPECIQAYLNREDSDSDGNGIDDIFEVFKLYRIATYDNKRNGKNFGEQSILEVRSSDNVGLIDQCHWNDSFYIIIDSGDIVVVD